MKRIASVLSILILGTILVSACQKATPEPVHYTIHMTEYAYDPSTIDAKVGQQVTIDLVNDGKISHEILFGRDVRITDGHPDNYNTDMFKAAGVVPTITGSSEEPPQPGEVPYNGYEVHLAKPGDKATISFQVTQDMVGDWEMGCFELDGVHYTSGMKGTFTVTP